METLVSRASDRPYDIPLNVAIWMAFKPILKVYLSMGTGFVLAKTNVLTPQLSKGLSQLVLLILMPALLFNNIVTNIKDTDIKLFGVIVLSGFIYYVVGLGYGYLVSLITPIPRAWIGGLLLCCMLNNCSDLPLAYVQAIGKSPFLPSNSASVGQSYCVLIVIIFIIFTFNLGGTRLIEWDATRNDPRAEEPTDPILSPSVVYKNVRKWLHHRKASTKPAVSKPAVNTHSSGSTDRTMEKKDALSDLENQLSSAVTNSQASTNSHEAHVPFRDTDQMPSLGRVNTNESLIRARRERHFGSADVYYATRRNNSINGDEDVYVDAPPALVPMDDDAPLAYRNLAALRHQNEALSSRHSVSTASNPSNRPQPAPKSAWQRFRANWFRIKQKNWFVTYIFNFLEDLFLPQMLALIAGITICMIPWVRRVFVKGQTIAHFHDAPDEMPPLDFLMEFLSFFAAAQVPLGLMLLGGTIASLKFGKLVKGFWKTLVLICLFKLVLLPIIACGWISRIRDIGWIDKSDALTPIVLAVAAGTPSATVQIYLTLAWIDPNKESVAFNCLAVSLMAQYALLPITLTILMSYVIMNYV